MVRFLDPETAEILQFLDPEITKMDKQISGSRNRRNGGQILCAEGYQDGICSIEGHPQCAYKIWRQPQI